VTTDFFESTPRGASWRAVGSRHPPRVVQRLDDGLRAWVSARPWLDTPLLPAAVLAVAATSFVVLRLLVAGHGDISTFVQAGSQFSDPARVPHGLAVRPGSGYDGQFYYRLALQPWNLAWSAHGITFDFALRRQRVTYAWLAWLTSGGHAALVPYTLVIVNVAGLALLGLMSGLWARSLGRHALWGLLPAGYFGFVWGLSRDLTEITTMALVIAGIVAWRSERPVLAGLAFTAAALDRETALLAVVALLVTRVVTVVRGQDGVGRADTAWAIPLVAFAAWQGLCLAVYGQLPLTSEGGNTSAPVTGAARSIAGWIEHPRLTNALELLQLIVLVVLVVAAARNLRRSRSSPFERLAFVFAVLLLLMLSSSIWNDDPRQFRTMGDVFALGSGVLLGCRSLRPLGLTAMTWAVWSVVAALSIVYI
jgi:hypothetical protein